MAFMKPSYDFITFFPIFIEQKTLRSSSTSNFRDLSTYFYVDLETLTTKDKTSPFNR